MRAIVRQRAGKGFSTMKVVDIAKPIVQPDELRVGMAMSRVNPVDMDLMKGFPSLKYKKPQIGGIDGAGVVLEVGSGVDGFVVGDKVLFYRPFSDIGTWAEEIAVKAGYCAKVPENIHVKEAGAIALPLLTAYDSLQQFHAGTGDTVLIHGVAGGCRIPSASCCKANGAACRGYGPWRTQVPVAESRSRPVHRL